MNMYNIIKRIIDKLFKPVAAPRCTPRAPIAMPFRPSTLTRLTDLIRLREMLQQHITMLHNFRNKMEEETLYSSAALLWYYQWIDDTIQAMHVERDWLHDRIKERMAMGDQDTELSYRRIQHLSHCGDRNGLQTIANKLSAIIKDREGLEMMAPEQIEHLLDLKGYCGVCLAPPSSDPIAKGDPQ